jgi:hypothetical protein
VPPITVVKPDVEGNSGKSQLLDVASSQGSQGAESPVETQIVLVDLPGGGDEAPDTDSDLVASSQSDQPVDNLAPVPTAASESSVVDSGSALPASVVVPASQQVAQPAATPATAVDESGDRGNVARLAAISMSAMTREGGPREGSRGRADFGQPDVALNASHSFTGGSTADAGAGGFVDVSSQPYSRDQDGSMAVALESIAANATSAPGIPSSRQCLSAADAQGAAPLPPAAAKAASAIAQAKTAAPPAGLSSVWSYCSAQLVGLFGIVLAAQGLAERWRRPTSDGPENVAARRRRMTKVERT